MSRTLVVMRHAKAEQAGATDHARVLAERGRRDAEAAGRWLAQQGIVIDAAHVSDAARTWGTWIGVQAGSGSAASAAYDAGLYHAGPQQGLESIWTAPDDATGLIVIGHNPTMAWLADRLSDGTGSAWAQVQDFPTSAMAVFAWAGPWTELTWGAATMTHFVVPRG